MKNLFVGALVIGVLMVSSVGECRIGGGRSFGSRGSRGFAAPRYQSPPSSFRNYQQPAQPQTPPSYSRQMPPASGGSSFLRNLGAGMAGGFLGSMLFRSVGMGGYGGMVGSPTGGIGILEILFFGGLIFLVIRFLMNRNQTTPLSRESRYDSAGLDSGNESSGAADLMRRARPNGWGDRSTDYSSGNAVGNAAGNSAGNYNSQTNYNGQFGQTADFNQASGTAIDSEKAMDLFFKVQGAWGNRDLTPVQSLLDTDARSFLDHEINRLKAARQINRLENIAVRNVDVMETWRESIKEYSTVRFTANLLDFTVQEDTQAIVEGSKTDPVKFEEYWTFSKDVDSSNWKLSAIQQS